MGHELARERAQGMLAARRQKIRRLDRAAALNLKTGHELGQSDMIRNEILGIAPEEAHGLKMDPAHMRLMLQPEPNDIPKLIDVHATRHGRHEHDAEPRLGRMIDGFLFDLEAGPGRAWRERPRHARRRTAKKWTTARPRPIFRPSCGSSASLRPVGVELHKTEIRPSWPAARFPSDPPAPWVLRRTAAGCSRRCGPWSGRTCAPRTSRSGSGPVPPAVREADRTVQVAARGDLHQGRTGPLGMTRAQTAIIRAAPAALFAHPAAKGKLGPHPAGKSRFPRQTTVENSPCSGHLFTIRTHLRPAAAPPPPDSGTPGTRSQPDPGPYS
jgi:hypothetical protein